MRLLLIHQNFPGLCRQLAPHLEQRGHELVAIASHERPIALKGRVLRYKEPGFMGVPLGTQIWHEGLERAHEWRVLPSSCSKKAGVRI